MLTLSDVHASYGPIEALKGISLNVGGGEIVALIGANGAGKTSALMTISGIMRPKRGRILFEGSAIEGLSPHRITALGISQVPEGRRIFPRLTVMENLEMGAFIKRDRAEIDALFDEVFRHFPILKDRRDQPGGTLSGGEQQMLAIGRALMAGPDLLLLDEPSLGLAPLMVAKIFSIIREINAEGKTILLVEQNARAALGLAHRGYVMETGKIVYSANAETLRHDPRVRSAYLGEETG